MNINSPISLPSYLYHFGQKKKYPANSSRVFPNQKNTHRRRFEDCCRFEETNRRRFEETNRCQPSLCLSSSDHLPSKLQSFAFRAPTARLPRASTLRLPSCRRPLASLHAGVPLPPFASANPARLVNLTFGTLFFVVLSLISVLFMNFFFLGFNVAGVDKF